MSLKAFLLSFRTQAPKATAVTARHGTERGEIQSGTLTTTGVLIRVMISVCQLLAKYLSTLLAPQSRCHYRCVLQMRKRRHREASLLTHRVEPEVTSSQEPVSELPFCCPHPLQTLLCGNDAGPV